jgi:RNA recognition motif-containing protein
MEKRLIVEDLPADMDEAGLTAAFSVHGTVVSAEVARDSGTGESKGFGFVEMETEEDAEKALGAMDGKDVEGHQLSVNQAQPRRPPARPSVKSTEPW